MNTRNLTLAVLGLLWGADAAFAQYAVRGFPEANRVYAYGGYSAYAPVGNYAPPHVGYPVGTAPANTAYYAPQPQQANAAYYAPQQNALSAYYSPISSYSPTINYAYRPTTYGSSLIPPSNPGIGYGVPGVSPFVRPQPTYAPPVYTYRPGTATLPVTYYRPVTVYDPVSGVPVTYMSACTGTECYGQPQRTWAGMFQHHKPPCANGNCGTQPTGVPYYPTPGTVPSTPVPSTTIPSTTPPGTIVYPSAQPPLSRTTVPPPTTISPAPSGSFPAPPSNFGAPRTGPDPANLPPNLNNPPPTTFNPNPTSSNYPPTDQQPTTDGKSFYYYRGVVREPFSNQPSSESTQGQSQYNTQRPEYSKPMLTPPAQTPPQNPMMNQPMNGNPMNGPLMNQTPKTESGTSFRGFAPPDGYRSDARPSSTFPESTSRMVPVDQSGPPVAPEFKPSVIPVIRPPMNTDVRPVPDPEPTRPVNRAPQLLNPRDKTAQRPISETTTAGYERVKLSEAIDVKMVPPPQKDSEGWRSVAR